MSEIEVKNNKMTNCKTCGTEIAKDAKVCPNCGAKQKKKPKALIGILVVVILIAIIAAVAGGGSDTDVKTEYAVGEVAELKEVKVTLVSVTENAGSEFNTPAEGNVYVLCEFEIENNSNKDVNVSSMLCFEAYCDSYTCNMSIGALVEKGDKNQLDGTVAAGKKFNGVIGYEVPADWKELEIKFTPDFWSGKDITFIAKND